VKSYELDQPIEYFDELTWQIMRVVAKLYRAIQ
jgi:hypothetical protein